MERLPLSDTFEKLPRGRSTPLPPPSALATAAETAAFRARRNATFWALASTSVWAFALELLLDQKPVNLSFWAILLRYPIICGIASLLLLRRNRGSRVPFAVLNVAAGLAWAVFIFWIKPAFWR